MRTIGKLMAISLLGIGAAGQAPAQSAEIGKTLYMTYCAACHGETAKGDGDMASVMTIPATNLTLLAKKNDGTFPMLKVIHIIDGRTGIRAHGGPMPIFGQTFSDTHDQAQPGDYTAVLETRGRILSLAMYLETLQQ
ncbi:c-type cytochrome [Acidimangrovimonas sediminis]|uniref:c-type cytochrome n=1 Tax=Acidimangrovimonas sediminis TaxID=2056283 RepID=UPI001E619758|nr:c-type cytochrome [Acidimangrovimonas sediminis]